MTHPRSYVAAPEPSGRRCRFRACLRLPFPTPSASDGALAALSINLTVRTMLLVAAIVGLAWAFVYIREAVMTLFLVALHRPRARARGAPDAAAHAASAGAPARRH